VEDNFTGSKITPVLDKYLPDEYFDFKSKIHERLLDIIDLSLIDSVDQEKLDKQIRHLTEKILLEQADIMPLNFQERETIISEIVDEVLGLGPLEIFLKDPTISEIMVSLS